jgi:HEAT repeat protein
MGGWRTVAMKKVGSSMTMIAGLIAGCVLFSGIVRDQWENAPYRPLIRSLRSDKRDERLEAALELGVLRLGGASLKTAVLPLAETLDDPDSRVREAAADTLAFFGPDAASATPTLARIIRDDHSGLRARAIRVVGLIDSDEARSVLAEAMSDPDPDRRIEAASVIGNLYRMAAPNVPLLLENLRRSPTAEARRAILSALVAIEPTSDRVAQARSRAISDPDPETRKAAVLGLGSPDPLLFISLLRQAAGDHDAGVRIEAIRMLSHIGLKHPDAVPSLCQALADPSTREETRTAISSLNWGWGQRSKTDISLDTVLESAVPALVFAAKRYDPRTRGAIVSLLCRLICAFGREDKPLPSALRAAVPQLVEIVKNAEPIVRLYALLTLLEEPPNELLLPILGYCPCEQGKPPQNHASPLHDTWPAAISAVDSKLEVRDLATRTPVLIYLLPDDVVEGLLPTLTATINDDDQEVRVKAMSLLRDVVLYQPSRPTHSHRFVRATTMAITAALKNRFPEIRELACVTLGDLGATAEEAVLPLRALIAIERDPAVRARAEQAVSYISIACKRESAP